MKTQTKHAKPMGRTESNAQRKLVTWPTCNKKDHKSTA